MTWRLRRTAQCDKCPWRVATNPHEIPNGYSVEQHLALRNTIAGPVAEQIASLVDPTVPLRIMACHESHDAHCIGWLVNQQGDGNNMRLRMALANCENAHKVRLRGEQFENFDAMTEQLRA